MTTANDVFLADAAAPATPPAAEERPPLFRRRFTRPGAAPGKFAGEDVPDSSRIRVIRYDADRFEETDDVEPDALPPVPTDGGVLWVDLRGVQDHEAVEYVAKRFGLSNLATADVVNVGQRPKAEDVDGGLFVILRMAVCNAKRTGAGPPASAWRWEQVALFLGQGYLVSFQEIDGDCLDGLRNRLRNGAKGLRRNGPDTLTTSIIDAVVDGYFPLLEDTGEQLEDLEDEVIDAPGRNVLNEVYDARRRLLTFRRSTWPLRDVLTQLVRDGHPRLGEHVLPYLRDSADHAVQIAEVLESYRELTGSLVDVYLSGVSNRTNETMRVLTIISTIFIPLTFIAGVYGMNLEIPEARWPYAYEAFWVVCGVVTAAMVVVFRRLGWLGGGGRK